MDLEELKIESLGAGGVGISRLANGKVVLLPKTLKGEKVLATLEKSKSNLAWGKVQEVLTASEDRVLEDCPWADECGGCDFLHVNPKKALELKTKANLSNLIENFKIDYVESPQYLNYRSRVTLHLDFLEEENKLSLGFYNEKRSLVVFANCLMMKEEFLPFITIIRVWAETLEKYFKNLEVHFLKGEDKDILICFSPNVKIKKLDSKIYKKLNSKLEDLYELFLENNLKVGLASKISYKSDPQIIKGSPHSVIYAFWPELDLNIVAFQGSFTQVNPEINKKLVSKILEEAEILKESKFLKVLDLYSGLGNISLPLLKSGFYVTAVEENSQAVLAAQASANKNKAFQQIRGTSEKALQEFVKKAEKFDLVVLDPPRAGAKDLAFNIVQLAPKTIIYISCHPAALERDLPSFRSLGYSVKNITVYDMFPRTSHIEILTVLSLN